MSEPKYAVGERFDIQFVWQLPNTDFLRGVFQAEVTAHETFSQRYVILLATLQAGRQEGADGTMRALEEVDEAHWALVKELVGRKAEVAYEAADGRPIRLRLPTLTRDHNYFTRYD